MDGGARVLWGCGGPRLRADTFGTTEQFADFIGSSLLLLHSMGLWCGVAMFIGLRILGARAFRPYTQMALVFLMMLLTFCSNRFIIMPMQHDRTLAGGNISVLLPGSPLREDFDARHAWSTKIESVVIFAGLGLAVLIGMEAGLRERLPAGPPRKIFDLSDDA